MYQLSWLYWRGCWITVCFHNV